MADYKPLEIEQKWQQWWQQSRTYQVGIDPKKPKYYILDMFPYPSGAGLHVGHPLGYIATDILSRFKRLKGYNVLHPMGFDAFGLPAEQYAIQTGQHPATTTDENIARYKEQLTRLGLSYDWSREFRTCEPAYYKWTQWIFKQLFHSWYNQEADRAESIETLITKFEKEGNLSVTAACDIGTPAFTAAEWRAWSDEDKQRMLLKYRLTYLAETTVNWCPALGTVLSNDEVKDGFSERGGHPVIKKSMPQWSMRITAYADRLLAGLEKIDWPEPIKDMQRNWIGKSYGAEVDFRIENSDLKIRVFTTRIDTLYGVAFLVLAPESEMVSLTTTAAQKEEMEKYVEVAKNRSERDRMSDTKTVSGIFTGSYALNPLSGERVPIFVADYVLAGYGTGAVMAVPSGDQRDFDFATHFGLPKPLILDAQKVTKTEADPTKEGRMINSGILNGLTYREATEKAIDYIESQGLGKRKVNYRMRDAIFGRQRYWGEPFPVYFKNDLPYLLEDDQLPLHLPAIDKFLPTADGEPPLGRAAHWVTKEGHPYELTTMPGWAGSSWYFFRYMDPHNGQEFAGKEALDYWQDVDLYMGGSEHATGHLLYSRFWAKFLYDLGYVKVDEYAKKLVNQGMIQGRSNFVYRVKNENKYVSHGLQRSFDCYPIHVDVGIVKDDVLEVEAFRKSREDAAHAEFVLEEGKYLCGWEVEKMSKSKYNVVNPDDLIGKYGADTLRMYEMFLGPIEQSKPWNTNGIEGVFKFLRKFWGLFHDQSGSFAVVAATPTAEELTVLHSLIKKIEDDVARLSLNTSVSNFMIATNELSALKCNKRTVLEAIVILLAPYAPHISEELWHLLGYTETVFEASFPAFDEKHLIQDIKEYPVMINGKMRARISFASDTPIPTMEQEALTNELILKWLEGKPAKKVIVVPGKVINVVV